eukprot:PhM_4_TR10796/c0_g2_i1/m.48957
MPEVYYSRRHNLPPEADTASECFMWRRPHSANARRVSSSSQPVSSSVVDCDAQQLHFNIFHQDNFVEMPMDRKHTGIRPLGTILKKGDLPNSFAAAWTSTIGVGEQDAQLQQKPSKRRVQMWRWQNKDQVHDIAAESKAQHLELKRRERIRDHRKKFMDHLREVGTKRAENRCPIRPVETSDPLRIMSVPTCYIPAPMYPMYQGKALCSECVAPPARPKHPARRQPQAPPQSARAPRPPPLPSGGGGGGVASAPSSRPSTARRSHREIDRLYKKFFSVATPPSVASRGEDGPARRGSACSSGNSVGHA